MNIQITSSSNKTSQATEKTQAENYKDFTRPLTAKLLEAMNLAKNYVRGEGDYLFYEKNHKMQKVLDLTGGYGANLLGHRHPQLLEVINQWTRNGSPSMVQGSSRQKAGDLAKKISEVLHKETGEGPWITHLSNSGTEAVEAAMKHSLIHFKHKLVDLNQEIEKEINEALLSVRSLTSFEQRKILIALKTQIANQYDELKMPEDRRSYLLHQLVNAQTLDELAQLLREINALQINQKPKFIALKKAYHGKTLGALSLTSNEGFRQDFFLGDEFNNQTIFISTHEDRLAIEDRIQSTKQDLIYFSLNKEGISVTKQSFAGLAAAFAEPIQGEAGILAVPSETLSLLKKYSLEENFLLVFDEIQSGMFRTGLMSAAGHHHITADVYTFSKSLGGGIAKIAATTIMKRKYIEEFGFLHTSTFAEDDFSCEIALEVFKIIESNESPLAAGMEAAQYLEARLEYLKSQFPDVVKDSRGIGLLRALEFNESVLKDMGFEFKVICDSKMQGYLIASALLNHEDLRMNPSLSNNLTLRIQPSLYFDIIKAEHLITGLFNLCQAIREKNVQYFLSAIYPDQHIVNEKTDELIDSPELGQRPLSVFLCHMINETHIRQVTKALKGLPDSKLAEKLRLTKDIAEFQIYHHQVLKDKHGQEMDVIMLGIPLTSEELKKTFTSRQKYQIVQKVQRAIDYSKELGATTVGLGQFTSIVSGNGLYLNPRGMNLTTGNAYTISLTIQSALRSAKEKGKNLNLSTVALIGAAGNIMSVASSLMADKVGKVILIHHSAIETSFKYQEAVKRILKEIYHSSADTKVVQIVKKFYTNDIQLLKFLEIPEVQEVFQASSDLHTIKDADIVLSGTSASSGFLTLDLFKQDAVIVDIAVPPTIKKELLEKLPQQRPDLTYHLGGIAKLPQKQHLNFFLLPLAPGESFACMAETFTIGFSGKKNKLHIGDLSKEIVNEVEALADEVGFTLGNCKTESSL
jgi:acetylornithine/succinyldiaminopimelate/putrescine aminotransferase/predicted amino acid dehydrogenase